MCVYVHMRVLFSLPLVDAALGQGHTLGLNAYIGLGVSEERARIERNR